MARPDEKREALEATESHAPSMGSGMDETVKPSATEKEAEGFAAPGFGPPAQKGEVGTLGPYRIVKELGRGGMGAVYAAVDTRLDRRLALKVMLPRYAADVEAKERFLREARAAAKVSHDNVVTIYEADEREGVAYIAMQFLQGYPLDEYLKKKGNPSLPQVVRIAREAAAGLAAAHRIGLVHRDIKPGNLWLEAPNGRVKVLDFGLAKPLDADVELTKSGAIVGTPAYMAPEQARGLKVDHRADLFSLGVMLYRLCTGRLPFQGPNTMAVLMALGTEEPAPVRTLNATVPEALAGLIHQLLAKKPEQRLASATEVAKRLREIGEQMGRGSAAESESKAAASAPVVVSTATSDNPFADLTALQTVEPDNPFAEAGPTRAAVELAPRRTSSVAATPAATVAAGPAESRRPLWIMALACGFGLPLVMLGITFFLQTPDGVVRFEINDPQVKVTIDKEGPTITGADAKPITLKPGKHGLTITRGDFTFDTKAFAINKGDESVLKVEWLPGKLQVSRDGKLLDAKDRPLFVAPDVDVDRRGALRVLELGGTVRVNGEGTEIGAAAALPKDPFTLTYVHLMGTRVSDEDLGELAACKGLTALHLGDTGVTDAGLGKIKDCTSITMLWLHGTKATDEGLAHLRGFKDLGFLHVGGASMTGVGAGHLAGCTHLSSLHMGGLKLSDEAIPGMVALKGLANLDLHDTTLTDAELARLSSVERLVLLDLTGTAVTSGGVEAFRKTKPGCTVVYGGRTIEPSAGEFVSLFNGKDLSGWKAHPDFPGDWRVENGVLVGSAKQHSVLFSEHEYGDVHVRLEASVGAQTSAGLLVRGSAEKTNKVDGGPLGYIAKINVDSGADPRRTGSLYVVEPEGFERGNGLKDSSVKADEWFTMEVIATGGHVVVRVNGQTTTDFQDDKPMLTGRLGLQFYQGASTVRFRKILVREIKGEAAANLDGAWNGEALTVSGVASQKEKAEGRRLVIAGERYSLTFDNTTIEGAFRHDSTANPKTLEFTPQKGGAEAIANQPQRGIYILDGDFLKFCVGAPNGPRPTGFDSSPKGWSVQVYRRASTTDAAGADPDRKAAEWALSVGGKLRVNDAEAQITGADQLPTAAFTVTHVELNGTRLQNEDLRRFRDLPGLREIYLHNTLVGDAGLEQLGNLPRLRAIHLGAARVTDRGAKTIGTFKELTWVNLGDVDLTDVGVKELANLDKLTSLRLHGTKTTDDGLGALKRLKGLIYLSLRKTKVTAKGVAEFHAAVPGCRVDYDGGTVDAKK